MIRGIVITVLEGLIKRFSASGRAGETIGNREYMQHYGYTSRPKPGAEIIIINEGNHYLAIASDDRRYRLAVEEGEVALYTDEGDAVHMKRGNNIEVTCGNKLLATVENEVEVITKAAKVNASVSCAITSSAVTINASTSTGVTSPAVTITASGSVVVNSPSVVLGAGATRSLLDERAIARYNEHTHGNFGANPPSQQMSTANHATSVTKAL
jgi:phage gp45-like